MTSQRKLDMAGTIEILSITIHSPVLLVHKSICLRVLNKYIHTSEVVAFNRAAIPNHCDEVTFSRHHFCFATVNIGINMSIVYNFTNLFIKKM